MGAKTVAIRAGDVPLIIRLAAKTFFAVCFVVAPFCCSAFAQGDLASAINGGTNEEKRNALFKIRNLQTAQASRLALPALSDKDVAVRATAAASVVFLPSDEAASALMPLLLDRNEFVRREVAYALGTVRNSLAVRPLLNALSRERASEARSAAIIALGQIGDAAAIPTLTEILRRKPKADEEFERRSSARSIGQIAQRLGGADNPPNIINPQNFLPDRFKDLAPAQRAFSPDESALIASAATELRKVVTSEREADDTRREAAFALGAIGDRTALPVLRTLSASRDNYLAEICREAVAKILTSKNN